MESRGLSTVCRNKANQSWLGPLILFLAQSKATAISHCLAKSIARYDRDRERQSLALRFYVVAKCAAFLQLPPEYFFREPELIWYDIKESGWSLLACMCTSICGKQSKRAYSCGFMATVHICHDSPCCVMWLSVWWQCGQPGPGLWWQTRGAIEQPSP